MSDRSRPSIRRVSWTGTALRTQAWDLDAVGNWSSITTDGVAENRSHDHQNRIDDSGFYYDANGNLQAETYDQWVLGWPAPILGTSRYESMTSSSCFACCSAGRGAAPPAGAASEPANAAGVT